jgi:ribosomal protein S18 acetylase RimI-like enzyme
LDKKKLSYKNIKDLEELNFFLHSNPIGSKTFRYFSSRDLLVIKNHIITCLYYDNEDIIGYGHLDYENEKTWLGVIVSDSHTSKGYGNMILDDLISSTNDEIYLSVDKNNYVAQNLYKKKQFIKIQENNKNIIMLRKNG